MSYSPKNLYMNKTKRLPVASGNVMPGIFSSFIEDPGGIAFAQQENDERVILFTRRHFASNFPWIIITLIAILIPPLFFVSLRVQDIINISLKASILVILTAFYYLIILGYAFYNFVDWFYNIGIITQKRIIDIDFINLSVTDISATQLREIEDATYLQKGFFSSLFNYGDVIARTVAGKEELFVFEKVSHPEKVVDLLSKLL